jgi:hypothetical protein
MSIQCLLFFVIVLIIVIIKEIRVPISIFKLGERDLLGSVIIQQSFYDQVDKIRTTPQPSLFSVELIIVSDNCCTNMYY